jgi:hypothetical protein
MKHTSNFRHLTKAGLFRRVLPISVTAGLLCLPFSAWGQTSPCDLNKDGSINITDVTLGVSMVLGTSQCTASINGTGGCNVAMVQRVVGAALPGGTCHPTVLTWGASSSSNIAGYNVYRGTASGGPYTKLNTALITVTTFTDATSQPGQIYFYVATAVDTSGNESAYSSPAVQANIPTP